VIKTVAVDFDGTISDYRGFRGSGVFGEPVGGAREALEEMKRKGWRIIVNTCRLEVDKVASYMNLWSLPYDYINFNPEGYSQMLHPGKVLADAYVDDRSVSFRGDWKETVEELDRFTPWWREEEVAR